MSEDDSCILYLFVVETIVTGTIIVGGIIGNNLVFVIFWNDNLKTSATFLFQSLAIVDSAFLLLSIPVFQVPPFVAYTNWLKGYEDIDPYVVVYILPLSNTVQTASRWVVVLFAVNRYIAVCFPFKSLRWCTIAKVKKQLAFVLLCAVLYSIPMFAEYRIKYVTKDNGTTYTSYVPTKLGTGKLYGIIYNGVFYIVFLVALPIFTLTYVNIRLIQALKARRRKRAEMGSRRQQNDNNVTVVLIIVVVVFIIICQIPAFVGYMLLNVMSEDVQFCGGYDYYFRPVANMLLVLNSAVNFVIYVLFNKRFRHVLARTLRCCSVTEVDGRRSKSTGQLPRVSVVSSVTVSQENDTDSSVEETRI